jgi:hypothetical protein
MAFLAFNMCDETYAASIALLARIIQTLLGR